jgi:hypothetical protein
MELVVTSLKIDKNLKAAVKQVACNEGHGNVTEVITDSLLKNKSVAAEYKKMKLRGKNSSK